MKWQGRRQSSNVEMQTPKNRAIAEQGARVDPYLEARVLNPEPIAYNQDPPSEEVAMDQKGLRNPGKSLAAFSRKVEKGVSDAPFFKHTIKDNK